MIFWGGLLCVLDFKCNSLTNGSGFSFDILNDALGVLLILVGVIRLRQIGPPPGMAHRPSGKLAFAAFVAVLAWFKAVNGHLVYNVPEEMTLVLTAVSLFSLAAIMGFCVAMQEMCRDWGLTHSQAKWQTTAILFGFIYVAPLGFLYLYTAGSLLSGEEFHLQLGPEGMLLLIPLLIPLVMLFTTTSAMVGEIRALPEATDQPQPPAASLRSSSPRTNPPDPTSTPQVWTVRDDPLPPKHPGATDRVV